MILIEDLNGHIRIKNNEYNRVYEDYDFGTRNEKEKTISNFKITYELIIFNTFSKKRAHLVTFNSENNKSQFNFFYS